MRFSLTDVVCAIGVAVMTVLFVVWGVATVIQNWSA